MRHSNYILLFFYLLIGTPLLAQHQEWEVIDIMPIPVADADAVVAGDYIYIIGGYTDSTQSSTNIIQRYEPSTKEWKFIDSMGVARDGLTAELLDSTLVICGGIKDNNQQANYLEYFNYYTSENTLSNFNKEFRRRYHTTEVLGDNLYIFGGTPNQAFEDSAHISYHIIYDLNNQELITSRNYDYFNILPFQQMSVKITINFDDYILLFGGIHNTISSRIYFYNTSDTSYTRLPIDLLMARAGGIALNDRNQKIYIIGGYAEGDIVLDAVEILSVNNDSLSIKDELGSPLKVARTNLTGAILDNYIYIFGGYNANQQVEAKVERLSLEPLVSVEDLKSANPKVFKLCQNYPNPFNPSTTIRFYVSEYSNVKLEVYNSVGEHVKTLVNEGMNTGSYKVTWNADDTYGNEVASGIYFYRMSANNFSDVQKMILIR